MLITSIVPFNDRFSLILIQKIAYFLIISSFCSSKAQLNNRATSFNTPLQVKGYQDLSFDELQLCDDVLIDLRKETRLNGLIHSPDYRPFSNKDQDLFTREHTPVLTKCKWTIIAPEDHQLQIKLVDFDTIGGEPECPDDRLEVRSADQEQMLWIELADGSTSYKYENHSISSCDLGLKPFLTINSNSSRLHIHYHSTNSNLNFLISFRLKAESAHSQICRTQLLSNLTHTSLIDKSLLCNCAAHADSQDPCSHLERHFGEHTDARPLDQCAHFNKLNRVCRTAQQPHLQQICYQVTKTSEHGWIASPSFHSKSYHNTALNCTYRILIQPYQTIQLRFKYFHLSAGSSMRIYDAADAHKATLLANYTSDHNDFKANFYAKPLNSNTNSLLIKVGISEAASPGEFTVFNFTYQIKGLCIESQQECASLNELECYAPEQRCNGAWDCRSGADERGCFGCAPDHFRCRNNIFCYKYEDRCDGDYQCVDKSDELECDKWTCNSANGTFLCRNGRCIYEQWVCDGANDCEDNSDEQNCPSGLSSRRVITTAVLGGTLCCLLLVMALGCACKLYTLHTAAYRGSYRFGSAPAHSAAARRRRRQRHRTSYNLSSFIRRLRAQTDAQASQSCDVPVPQHSVAPPTYNQTMGLVDEYEQRQLAFIEHVRSILSQQQQQQQQQQDGGGTSLTSMTIVPTSTSSARVNNRRLHRHRHHRSSEESRHRRRHRQSVNSSQASFDLNRRGLAEAQETCSQLASVPEAERAAQPPKTINPSSANLRDKIAKLIKDIVVHHGDSINYVQLADAGRVASDCQADGERRRQQPQDQQPNTSQNSNSSEDDVPLIQP